MPERSSYEAAIVRVVPRVEREEFVNVGAVLFCPERRFLQARIALDPERLEALAPGLVDLQEVKQHLEHIRRVCAGDRAAGSLSALSQAERFHWLVAPRSTVIQVSPVHSGFCSDPADTLDHLVRTMVSLPK
jgi:Protein of unknown function (DUF3037)